MRGPSARWPWLICLIKSKPVRGKPLNHSGTTPVSDNVGRSHRPRARSVICLFQHGGPSQMDLFDPKPELTKHQGKLYPSQLEIHFDKHKNAQTHKSLCAQTDQPSAALVQDLKQRRLLDETIVLWTGEFGRLPISQGTDGP